MAARLVRNHQAILEKICDLIHNREFVQAEAILLELIEKIALTNPTSDYKEKSKLIFQTIYQSFNNYYYHYLVRNNIDVEKERQELVSVTHHNYLIANCSKIPEMDDMLYELSNYLLNNQKESKKEVQYHLKCYKNGRVN